VAPTSGLAALLLVILAALACVAASVRLGFGPVLGYLAAGVLVGPAVLGLLHATPLVDALAEFGVVFLLFAVGLELPLPRIRSIGTRPLALGLLQIGTTVLLLFGMALLLGLAAVPALVLAMALALSSTAVVVRFLADRGLLSSRLGRTAFAVLILQDLAVAPMLVAVLALAGRDEAGLAALRTLLAGGLVSALALAFARRPLETAYGHIARLGLDELMVGLSLLIALGFALAAEVAGLSLAFGGLLAGMVLAESGYRHKVAADIRAFRGLLVGLFFLSVGLRLDLTAALAVWPRVLALAVGLYLVKGALVAALARPFGFDLRRALALGALLGQGGEFAFVLLATAGAHGLLPAGLAEPVTLAVALGMALTPLLAGWALRRLAAVPEPPPRAVTTAEAPALAGHVVVAGAGSVGRQVAECLQQAGVPVLGLDLDPRRVEAARRRGLPFYYGDVTQPDVLDDVGLAGARALVLALDGPARTRRVMAFVRYLFPEKPVLVRAHLEEEVAGYLDLGATVVVPEVVETGRHLATAVVRLLPEAVVRTPHALEGAGPCDGPAPARTTPDAADPKA